MRTLPVVSNAAAKITVLRQTQPRFGAKNDVGLGNGVDWPASSFLVLNHEVSTGYALSRGRYMGSVAHALEFWGPKNPENDQPLPGAVRGITILKTIANLEAKSVGLADWNEARQKTLQKYDQEVTDFKAQKLKTRFWKRLTLRGPQAPSFEPAQEFHRSVKLTDILEQFDLQERPNVQKAIELMARNTYLLGRHNDKMTGEERITLYNNSYDVLLDHRNGIF